VAAEPLLAPIAIGDLIDRITILEIKSARIDDAAKRANVDRELAALTLLRDAADLTAPEMEGFATELRRINLALWDIEDEIRALDRSGDFGPRFVELARGVYTWNDRRAAVKHDINRAFGSAFTEEKSYGS
jgi:hypothetical protein